MARLSLFPLERPVHRGTRGRSAGHARGGFLTALGCLVLLLGRADAQPVAAGAAAAPAAEAVGFVAGGQRVGLGGFTRPGEWTPLRVELENPTAEDRDLTLSWWLPDAAGDRVRMRRRVAVPAGRTTAAWLYGVPAAPAPPEGWPVVATDPEGAVVAASAALADPVRRLDDGEELVVLMSPADLGLGDYARHAASQARRRLVRGLTLADLPDRVQGLLGVSAVVWAADGGGDPAAAGVPAAAISAWVRRGGHLVVVLPSVGERWTQSPLAPLLPLPGGVAPQRRPVRLPTLGVTRPPNANAAPAWVLPEAGGAVLLRSEDGEPLVVTARRGFGAVTLVGIDLSASVYRQEALPSGTRRFWNDVFGWSDPAVSEKREQVLRGELAGTAPEIKPARELPDVEVGRFVARSLGLAGSVTVALGVLLVLLILLPVAAGGAWAIAWHRRRRRAAAGSDAAGPGPDPLRWAWPAFAAVCVAGAAAGSVLALLGRPEGPSARHHSVIDLDPAAGGRRVRSRISLFLPGFGRAAVRVGEEAEAADGVSTLLSTAGLPGPATGGGFLDPQAYDLDAAAPDAVTLPLRSTTRPLRVDLARERVPAAARGVRLVGPATHRAGFGELSVTLESSLAADLRDVLIVYCPGEAYEGSARRPRTPLAWRYAPTGPGAEAGAWPAGGRLVLDGVPAGALPLVEVPPLGKEAEGFRGAGWLNAVLEQGGLGAASAPQPGATLDNPVRAWEALSLFGRLPPPDVATVAPPYPGWLRRSLPELVGVDLSALTSGPRLIVIGHAAEDALPLPLTLDGVEPPSSGRSVYRVVVDLDPPSR